VSDASRDSDKPPRSSGKVLLVAALIILILVTSASGVYIYQLLKPAGGPASGPTCSDPLGGAKMLVTQLPPPTTVGGVTLFALPTPIRAPSTPTVAPDGSVWFAEESVAGLAHFYPGNRTLVEYAWPFAYSAPPSPGGLCGQRTSTWGIVLWDGEVWATDSSGNQLVGFDPTTGAVSTVKIPVATAFPYTMTLGPNDTLWFAELLAGELGALSQNGTVRQYSLPGGTDSHPTQIVFVNSTAGYYSAVGNEQPQGGGVYSFNTTRFAPQLLGGQRLTDPSSLTIGSGALWVALHGSSSVASYNFTTKAWSYYPTTPISWAPTTLPYFVDANGSSVWVNEHYGDRMAMIDPANGTLTEYSESSQATNGTTIGNTLTFGVGGGRAWFAELTGNVLGYVDASYSPGFYTTIAGNSTVVVARGSSATVDLVVHDTTHQGGLTLSFADSEGYTSTPTNITYSVASASVSPPAGGESTVPVTVTALPSLTPGTYTAILTATDGLTYESSFLRIVVPG
jgi:streptogramin lyase